MMNKKIVLLFIWFFTAMITPLHAVITFGTYAEGGMRWDSSASGTVVSNAGWTPGYYDGTKYGKFELNANLVGDLGWVGWTRLEASILDDTAANMQFKSASINAAYRPRGLNFTIFRNQNYTWLGQPYLSIFGNKKDGDLDTTGVYFDFTDKLIKGLHSRTVIYEDGKNDNYLGQRFDGNWKAGKMISGSWGTTWTLKKFDAYSNNIINGAGVDANVNLILGEINVFMGGEVNRLWEPFKDEDNLNFIGGATNAQAYRIEGKVTIPTPAGNFNLNTYFQRQGQGFDANAQFNGTGDNWYEEFFQFLYAFPKKAIDFEFHVKYGRPVFSGTANFGDPITPTSTTNNFEWPFARHFWNYSPVFGTGQYLEYYGRLFIQFKKGISFFTSYQYYMPGSIRLWSTASESIYGQDALYFNMKFENEKGKIDLQYKIYRMSHPDPTFRIDAGGLELAANITKKLKYYSRLLLMNSGGQVTGNRSGSTTWWNYFGQLQYYPIQNVSIFLEYGNGGDTDWLTSNEGTTKNGNELARRLTMRFTYYY